MTLHLFLAKIVSKYVLLETNYNLKLGIKARVCYISVVYNLSSKNNYRFLL